MFEEITDPAQLEALLQSDHPVWLMKHSTTCPISAEAYRQFQEYLDQHPQAEAGLIVVQSNRALSNQAAELTGVPHQSPQVMLIRNGQVLFHTSHGNITVETLAGAIPEAN